MSARQMERLVGIPTPIAVASAGTILASLLVCAALSAPAQAKGSQAISSQAVGSEGMTAQAMTAQGMTAQAMITEAMPPSAAVTSAAIAPSVSPNRLGAKAALTFSIHYAGGPFGVPAPVRRSVMRFPAGLSLDIPHLSSCAVSRLRARGASGCPAQSVLGGGHALVETHAGSQKITEDVTMSAFLGPPQNLQPTFEILARGYTPLDQQMILTGTVQPGKAPYGEELVMSIPPIPTLPLEPYASIVSFSLTIGASNRHGRHGANSVLIPSRCPVGGFPFDAEFTYADGSVGSAQATTPCPA